MVHGKISGKYEKILFILEKIDLEFPPSTHTLDYVVVKRIRMQPYAVGL